MKLQLNTSGSWRNVIDFDVADSERLQALVAQLAAIAAAAGDTGAAWRFVDSTGRSVLHHDTRGWTVPGFSRGYSWLP